MSNIFLTGFMGAGKSTVGRILAKKLAWNFIDTDRMIEEKTGKSIADNFQAGEEAFRRLETEIILEVMNKTHHVIALGGGSIVSEANRLKVLGAGHLVYLKADSHTLFKRLEKAREVRPLLESKVDKEHFISELLKEREAVYLAANITIKTDGKSPEIVAVEVLKSMGMVQK